MSRLSDVLRSGFAPPSMLAGALALAESVACGLVGRYAPHPATVPLILTYVFVVPVAAGFLRVAVEGRRVGMLSPRRVALMTLAAVIAWGSDGVFCMLITLPVLAMLALGGGWLATLTLEVGHAVPAIAARVIARLRGERVARASARSIVPDCARRSRIRRRRGRQTLIRTRSDAPTTRDTDPLEMTPCA